jgi:hypothetical protein
MDDVKAWQQHATAIFPFERFGFVQILHADANRYSVGFVTGTVYQAVPDHPYEFVFVDGPAHQGSCNMDFIRHLQNHPELSVRAIIDRRLPTIRAYGTLLGRENVHYNLVTELGFVSPVSAADLLVNEENVVPMPVLKTGARLDWRLPL